MQHLHFDLCFGGEGGMPGLTCASSGVQEVVVWTAFTPSFRRVYFWARKSREKLDTQIRASPVQDFCHGCCLCYKVASSLTFCAHSSLQSFSTSDKMKGPKTGPPGGTTFDPKRVHFWVPSEIYLLCARVQNWALSILNLVPPWGLVWRPIQILSWGALLESGPTNISVTHHSNYELATSLEQGRPPPCLQKVCWFQVLKTNPLDMARCCS